MNLEVTVVKATMPEVVKKKNGEIVVNKSGVQMTKSTLVCKNSNDRFDTLIAFECVNGVAENASKFLPDTKLTVNFNVESREWEGRWFNSIKAYKFENVVEPNGKSSAKSSGAPSPSYEELPDLNDATNDLPF